MSDLFDKLYAQAQRDSQQVNFEVAVLIHNLDCKLTDARRMVDGLQLLNLEFNTDLRRIAVANRMRIRQLHDNYVGAKLVVASVAGKLPQSKIMQDEDEI